ncbi:hypothetical protein DACRYDRAFT_25664 [Dacryopinax primogenitus]|uniref:Uncharacterized protein n=1 Tax=Dacryopinax primogenitus (strain DJM 731) TaxID=1858805 RepID=M5FPN2_DACPD|nr:uncharacterized protein DACRYDRAFT_25664 [Dacryopinax primogenitus]EJT96529.1 hypothetical protein DACRYDRAFT_25664 [Dacryopinax primogenitus]
MSEEEKTAALGRMERQIKAIKRVREFSLEVYDGTFLVRMEALESAARKLRPPRGVQRLWAILHEKLRRADMQQLCPVDSSLIPEEHLVAFWRLCHTAHRLASALYDTLPYWIMVQRPPLMTIWPDEGSVYIDKVVRHFSFVR